MTWRGKRLLFGCVCMRKKLNVYIEHGRRPSTQTIPTIGLNTHTASPPKVDRGRLRKRRGVLP